MTLLKVLIVLNVLNMPKDPSPEDPSPEDPSPACCLTLKLLKVLYVLKLLNMPNDTSLAFWALFLLRSLSQFRFFRPSIRPSVFVLNVHCDAAQ